MDFLQFASNFINKNRDNIQNQEMTDVILNNDSKRGEEIADNILRSCGMTREQGIALAMQRFGIQR